MDYHNILGVPEKADKDTIKKAYRRAAKNLHPDIEDGDEEKMKIINVAYESLIENAPEVSISNRYRKELEKIIENGATRQQIMEWLNKQQDLIWKKTEEEIIQQQHDLDVTLKQYLAKSENIKVIMLKNRLYSECNDRCNDLRKKGRIAVAELQNIVRDTLHELKKPQENNLGENVMK